MALTTKIKHLINTTLAPLGLKIDTLTAERRELQRLSEMKLAGHFDAPCFPLADAISRADPAPVFRDVSAYAARFADLADDEDNLSGFRFDNPFFTSPDAEVMYAIVRAERPETIVEIGSGHSTRLLRLAVSDGGFDTRIVAIDPHPREEVSNLADVLHLCPVESLRDASLITDLKAGDILSIDSSHELRAGNDIVFLYLDVMPKLRAGVVVHIHDVFLPYEYPSSWLIAEGRQYNEQYLVQAILEFGAHFEVLWPGYFLQKSLPGFAEHFPLMNDRPAQSLWLRKNP